MHVHASVSPVTAIEPLPGHAVANSMYGMAPLGYLDSSVRSLAARVAKADLPCPFTRQCHQLLVQGPALTQGISVEESSNFLPDGSMSGVVAHVKLQQLTHFVAI
ncbi:hypothetical protein QJQ45_020900 [Haematococcus lacustris]|nr:hypothetical protein QJQ45_020900 [Haematococcus lacustris]